MDQGQGLDSAILALSAALNVDSGSEKINSPVLGQFKTSNQESLTSISLGFAAAKAQ